MMLPVEMPLQLEQAEIGGPVLVILEGPESLLVNVVHSKKGFIVTALLGKLYSGSQLDGRPSISDSLPGKHFDKSNAPYPLWETGWHNIP